MNPRLDQLHPYPFEKLRVLLANAGASDQGMTPHKFVYWRAEARCAVARTTGAVRKYGGPVGLSVDQG